MKVFEPLHKEFICESCFKVEAHKSCIACGKVLCKLCDFQIHILKQNSDHRRAKLQEAQHIINRCPDHLLKLKYFCETCNQPICDSCIKDGRHSSKHHSISSITESFQQKFDSLKSFISKELMKKFIKLQEKLRDIEDICQLVRTKSSSIEKEIKDFQAKLIEKLKYRAD